MTEPLDEDYLLSLAAERRPRNPQDYEQCAYCSPHPWHGLACRFLGDHCDCPTARTACC